jgi:aspartokinase-like uncharacterized kinase
MAILALDLYSHVLASHIPSAELVDDPDAISGILCRGSVVVLAPYRWMRSTDVLPHTWGVTSDSIAAVIAGALGATRLVLVKPAADGDAVDPHFKSSLPAGMSYRIVGWNSSEGLRSAFSE